MKKLIVLFLLPVIASAQLVMDFNGGDDLAVGPGTAGFEFTTGPALTVRSLGVWESSGEGLFNTHTVGIWDAASNTLLASAVVQASSATKIGEYWYVNITPLNLQAGHEYVIGATYADNDFDFARGNATSVLMGGGVTLGDAVLSNGTGFDYPNINVSGANAGFFGPNAGFAPVPEPAGILLATAAVLLGFATLRRCPKFR